MNYMRAKSGRRLDTFDPIPGGALSATLFGDSITNRNGSGDIVRTGESSLYNDSRGWFHWMNMLLGRPFRRVVNAGIGGDTTTNMVNRLTDITNISPLPGWLFGMAGINDEGALKPAQSIANLKTIFTAAYAAGYKRIVWMTVIPDNSNLTQRWVIDEINQWLKEYAAVTPEFTLVNWNTVFTDSGTGNSPTGYTVDGLHPTPLGAAVLGQYLADIVRPFFPERDWLAMSPTTAAISANPGLTGTTSGKATGYNVTGFTTLKAPRTDGRNGEWQVLLSAAAGGATFFQDISASGGTFQAGDTIYAECEFETDDDWTAATKLTLGLLFASNADMTGQTTASYDLFQNPSGSAALSINPRRGVLRTPNIVVPPQITAGNSAKVRMILDTDFVGTLYLARFGAFKKVTP